MWKPESIQSCVPGYKTDAIYRDENMDRYDDGMIVENNLIESYDLLMGFISKHTNDKFFLIDNVNISVRSAIAREIVSNLLVHREYGSAFPAKLIVEKDRIYTENWNRARRVGRIELQDFTPYPKNPILAKFFVNIGYADALGSGVRNLYKFTRIYSGGEPDFEEGDVFKLTVPLELPSDMKNKLNVQISDTGEVTEKVTEDERQVTELLQVNSSYTTAALAEILGISRKTVSKRLKSLKDKGIIERVGSNRKGYWKLFL